MNLYSNDFSETPLSFSYSSDLKPLTNEENIDTKKIESINNDSLINVINKKIETNQHFRSIYGVEIKTNFSLNNSGTWDTLDNGDKLWRLKINSVNAKSINLLFEKIYLENNCHIFIYSNNHEDIHPAFYPRHNNSKNKFSSSFILSDSIIVEYYEPKNVERISDFVISKVIHGFIDPAINNNETINKKNNESHSLFCERDANCPEGEEFCKEKYSIAIILAPWFDNLWGWCTGFLVNNTRNDYKPYLIAAYHALSSNGSGVSLGSDITDNWSFKFGYIRSGCSSGSSLPTNIYTGATVRAFCRLTDFALLELFEQPKPGDGFRDLYFNGWDRTGSYTQNVYSLHHPDRDMMKISYSDEEPELFAPWEGCPDDFTHFLVNWTTGTTEQGSSGSPIYNSDHRVIGFLHFWWCDGEYPCEPCDDRFLTGYGRFSQAWDNYEYCQSYDFCEGFEHRLKDWLDPDGTNVDYIDGISLPYNKYGLQLFGVSDYTAHREMRVGSSVNKPFYVLSPSQLTLKAGREIIIKPCTYIEEGSTFRAYIDAVNCSENFRISDSDDDYGINCNFVYPKIITQEYIFSSNHIDFNDKTYITNIPNPFAEEAEIIYGNENPSSLKIFVSDIFGKIVKVIVDSPNHPSGSFSITLDASELPNGTYYYTMQTHDKVITKKMVVLR